ncbi:MAG TPA: glycyl-radical enzyme activating protein [Kiritimatiellia bacterium]|nr:glycyl-radical enzyme activating protein [Kiritimatiellia bacterium]HPS06191.1 glycyl-radical enzyme activating protein [Kiritimatiellia bacterium]
MSTEGTIFEVREFCLHDGPGIRTNVFFKGCPLHCAWCHNPEGIDPAPQLLVNAANCTHCGACRAACAHPRHCVACGACVTVCPQGCRRLCGRRVSADTLAAELRKNEAFFLRYQGGITFSGGEPLMQTDFLVELAARLRSIHLTLETSGYASLTNYQRAVQSVDLVFQDLKHSDAAQHKRYTGVDSAPILDNLAWLKASGRPFIARIPLIPGVNDAPETLRRFAEMLEGDSGLIEVELLPYHLTAGAKYALLGLQYAPPFDPSRPMKPDLTAFEACGVPCRVM